MQNQNLLEHQKCVPCEGGIEPLSQEEISGYLAIVQGWILDDAGHITREFLCQDFMEALDLVNAVGGIAEEEGHHPDILIHDWNKVKLTLYTHAIKGLHLNDFILASRINVLSQEKGL